jgi:hypothetical protein
VEENKMSTSSAAKPSAREDDSEALLVILKAGYKTEAKSKGTPTLTTLFRDNLKQTMQDCLLLLLGEACAPANVADDCTALTAEVDMYKAKYRRANDACLEAEEALEDLRQELSLAKLSGGQASSDGIDADNTAAALLTAAEAEALLAAGLRKSIDDMTEEEAREALFLTQSQSQTQTQSPPCAQPPSATTGTAPRATAAPGAGSLTAAAGGSAARVSTQSLRQVCPVLKTGKFCGGCKGYRHPRCCNDPTHAVPRAARPKCDLWHLKPTASASGNAPRGTSSKTPNYNGRANSGGKPPSGTSGLGRYKDEQIAELTAKVWRLESSAFPPLPPPLPLRYSAVTAAPLQTAHATFRAATPPPGPLASADPIAALMQQMADQHLQQLQQLVQLLKA